MDYLTATELAAQIRYERPQYSSVTVIPVKAEYGVLLSWWTIKHDKYCCIEYEKFIGYASSHGFVVDFPDNGLLIKPEEKTALITSPGHWALVEAMRQPEATRSQNKGGRPCKTCPPQAA